MDAAPEIKKFSKSQVAIFICSAAIFLLAAVLGSLSGITSGQSEATYVEARNVARAVQYFKSDQGQYPTEDQFVNQQILAPLYLQAMPKPEDASGICAKYPEFNYGPSGKYGYLLQFCLKQGVAGFPSGENYFTALNFK